MRGLGAELEGWRPLVCVEGSEMRTQQKTRTRYLIQFTRYTSFTDLEALQKRTTRGEQPVPAERAD